MSYVDGFVIPIPEKNVKDYVRMARMGRDIWTRNGALDYRECVADDLANQFGTTFPEMLKLKRGETVLFSFVVFKSRAHRDRVNKKVMKEMEGAGEMKMPFDVRRMVYGGFKVLVDLAPSGK